MSNSPSKDHIVAGVVYALACSLMFAFVGLSVKLSGQYHHALEITFWRSLLITVFIGIWFAARGEAARLKKINYKRQLMRAVAGTVTMVLTFYAFILLPLTEAQSLLFSSPLIVAALSWPLLKEKVGIYRTTAILAGFGGILVILQPGTISSLPGGLAGLGAAAGQASVMLVLRIMGRTEDPYVTIFYFSLISAVLMLPFLPFVWNWPTLASALYLLLTGVFALFTQIAVTKAFFLAPAAVVAPVSYLGLLWVTLMDLVVCYIPPPSIYAGAAIIIISNLIVLYRERRAAARKLSASSEPEAES